MSLLWQQVLPVSYTHLDVYKRQEMDRPLVGIVSSYNEIVPGHMNLDKIVNAVKQGVAMAGGTPVVFPAIAVCDGIAMGHIGMKYSLVTRDLIADSTEAMAMAHQFDALVSGHVKNYVTDFPTPVSYTHLDVYKRQVWCILHDIRILRGIVRA